jgi:hypothetical protein
MYPLKKFDNEVFYNPSLTDTIFEITPEGLYPRYHMKMKGVPPLIVKEGTTNADIDNYTSKYSFFNGDFIDLKDALYFNFLDPGVSWFRFVLYLKERNQIFGSATTYYNPLFYFWRRPLMRYADNYLVCVGRTDDIIAEKDRLYQLAINLPPNKKEMLDELYRDLTEDDNPVLFFYRVRI